MTIAGAKAWGKAFMERIPKDLLVVAVLLLSATGSYGLGYLSGRSAGKGSPISIEVAAPVTIDAGTGTAQPSALASPAAPVASSTGGHAYVASKNGSKYYLATCAAAARISDANKVWFDSPETAKAAGYAPALNCPGL